MPSSAGRSTSWSNRATSRRAWTPGTAGDCDSSLTATGRKVHRQVEDMINLVEADLLAGIPADDLSTFFTTMSLLES